MTNNKSYAKKELYAYLTLEWCKMFFGENKRRKKKLSININSKFKKLNRSIIYGNFDTYRNIIFIYLNNHNTLLEVVQTIIHEYTHYLQSSYQYKKYQKIYNYKKNPYELEARNIEEKYGKKCLRVIRNQLKISNSDTSLKNIKTSSLC